MGGSAGAPGNTTPVSEFNFWCDPEAAKAVFTSGLPINMVGLDVTRQMFLSASALAKLACAPNSNALMQTLVAAMRFYQEFHQVSEGLSGCIVNDPLAVLLALDPEMGRTRPMYVHIDCSDEITRGQSVCDRFGFLKSEANAHVYLEVEAQSAMQLVWNTLAPGVLGATDF
jgi:purine nucleosidase